MSTKKLSQQSARELHTREHAASAAEGLPAHHALVCELSAPEQFAHAVNEVAQHIQTREGVLHVDVWQRTYSTLQIKNEDTKEKYVEEIHARARDAVARGTARLVAVFAGRITTEAQNALLKLVEEPPEQTVILLAIPAIAELLPTLRSRMVVYVPDTTHTSSASWYALSKKGRIATIDALVEKKDTHALRTLVREALAHLDALERQNTLAAARRIDLQTKFVHIDTLLASGAAPKNLMHTVVLLLP